MELNPSVIYQKRHCPIIKRFACPSPEWFIYIYFRHDRSSNKFRRLYVSCKSRTTIISQYNHQIFSSQFWKIASKINGMSNFPSNLFQEKIIPQVKIMWYIILDREWFVHIYFLLIKSCDILSPKVNIY